MGARRGTGATFRIGGTGRVGATPCTTARSVPQARILREAALRERMVVRALRPTWFCSVSTLVSFSNPGEVVRRSRRSPATSSLHSSVTNPKTSSTGDRGHRPVSDDQPPFGNFYSKQRYAPAHGLGRIGGPTSREQHLSRVQNQHALRRVSPKRSASAARFGLIADRTGTSRRLGRRCCRVR